jgi:Zn-dependent metalloprotease
LLAPGINGVAIRSMKAPGTAYDDPKLGKDPQPADMAHYLNTTQDNGGVHINSGIPNKAFFEVATTIGGNAWEKAGKIWYVTLTQRLQSNADFQTAANLTYAVAGDLFGSGGPEQQAVSAGWSAVGITVNAGASVAVTVPAPSPAPVTPAPTVSITNGKAQVKKGPAAKNRTKPSRRRA